MCTSGTTGIPKGVMLSDENIINNINSISDYFKISGNDKILISRPLYHCAVLTGEFLTAIEKGSKIEFYYEHFNPQKIIDIIREKNITVFGATPTLFKALISFTKEPDSIPLDKIVISGECLSSQISENIKKAFPHAAIYHVYGLTEASPRVCFLPPNLFDNYGTFVGFPINGVELLIKDKNGNQLKRNKIGILWIKGNNIMQGYYNDA